MEIARLVLEFLRVFLSPQVIIGAVVIVFFVMFRPAITAAIGRVLSFKGPGGVEATFGDQIHAAEEGKKVIDKEGEPSPKALEIKLGEKVTVTDQSKVTAAPAVDPQQLAAQFARWWAFEKVYKDIFLSQILLLRYLDVQQGRRASAVPLWPFYKQGILDKGVAPATYPWENYVRFLGNWGLIRWEGPSGQEIVSLTDFGVAFLRYIEAQNYNVYGKPN